MVGGGDNRWTLSFALKKQQGTRQAKPLHHLWRGRYGKDLSGDAERETMKTQGEARVSRVGWVKDDLGKMKGVCLSGRRPRGGVWRGGGLVGTRDKRYEIRKQVQGRESGKKKQRDLLQIPHSVRTKNQGGAAAGLTSPCSDASLAVCQPLAGMRRNED